MYYKAYVSGTMVAKVAKLRFKQDSGAALWDIAGKNGFPKLGKAAFYYLFKYLGADKGTSF